MTKCLFYCKRLPFRIENGSRHRFSNCQPSSSEERWQGELVLPPSEKCFPHINCWRDGAPTSRGRRVVLHDRRDICNTSTQPGVSTFVKSPMHWDVAFLAASLLMQNRQIEERISQYWKCQEALWSIWYSITTTSQTRKWSKNMRKMSSTKTVKRHSLCPLDILQFSYRKNWGKPKCSK